MEAVQTAEKQEGGLLDGSALANISTGEPITHFTTIPQHCAKAVTAQGHRPQHCLPTHSFLIRLPLMP